jgi:hypothetical protein
VLALTIVSFRMRVQFPCMIFILHIGHLVLVFVLNFINLKKILICSILILYMQSK